MLPELLSQIPARFQPIRTSSALLPTGPATRASATIPSSNEAPNEVLHGVLHEPPNKVLHGGAAAIIPSGKNGKLSKAVTAGAVARNQALRAPKYLGRALWRRWSGYHRRSHAKTKMHCVKLPGQRLMARNFNRQVAEFQIRLADLERLHRTRQIGRAHV